MKILEKESIKIMMVAAEASSAAYAAQLLRTWQADGTSVEAYGIGNKEMEKLGFKILGRSEELAVVGLGEIIAHWRDIKTAWDKLVAAATAQKPDVVLLMDYPEFNLRLAKKMKSLGIPVVYYISPQVWAWRTYRVHNIKKIVDLMLVIFPFEHEFYQKHGMRSKFVGHPLLDLLKELLPNQSAIDDRRRKLLNNKKNLLGLMPGSRKSEIKFNLQTQIETAKRITAKNSDVLPVLFVAPSLDMEFVQSQAQALGFEGEYIQEDPFFMISLADEILCASGTATLMVGLCKKPMVIMYKMKPFTAFLAKRFVRHIPFFGMVNLILKKEAVPERFQEMANPEELSRLLLEIISNTNGRRDQIDRELLNLESALGAGGGIRALAESLTTFVAERRS